jgi:hypothetical protein
LPELVKGHIIRLLTSRRGLEGDDEIALNLICFYKKLDEGAFIGHEDEWVMMDKQRVVKIGPKTDDDELAAILEETPSAVQMPVDFKNLLKRTSRKMTVIAQSGDGDDYKV